MAAQPAGVTPPPGKKWNPYTNSWEYGPSAVLSPATPPATPPPPPPSPPSSFEQLADANAAAGEALGEAGNRAADESEQLLSNSMRPWVEMRDRTRGLYGPGGELSGPGRDEALFDAFGSGLTDESEVEKLYRERLMGGSPEQERMRQMYKRSLAESFGGGGGVGNSRKEAEALNLLELQLADDEARRIEGLAGDAATARRERLGEAFGAAGDIEGRRVDRVTGELDFMGRSAEGRSRVLSDLGRDPIQWRADAAAAIAAGDMAAAEAIAAETGDKEVQDAVDKAKDDRGWGRKLVDRLW